MRGYENLMTCDNKGLAAGVQVSLCFNTPLIINNSWVFHFCEIETLPRQDFENKQGNTVWTLYYHNSLSAFDQMYQRFFIYYVNEWIVERQWKEAFLDQHVLLMVKLDRSLLRPNKDLDPGTSYLGKPQLNIMFLTLLCILCTKCNI